MGKDDVFSGLHKALEGKQFATIAEAQAFASSFMERQNRTPLPVFHGLSPEQMHRFLSFPFDSPDLVTFPSPLETEPKAPIITLFSLLVEAMGERGLKATAAGNLPRDFCREAALGFWGEERYRENTRFAGINKETDFFDMHVARIVAKLAGLVHRYRGRFILTKEGRRLLNGQGMAAAYPRLLQAYARRFNWAYWHGHEEIPFIQRSFLFTLWLLTRHGGDWRPHVFYEDLFLQAFPTVLTEAEPRPYSTPEQEVRSYYTRRAFLNFAAFFGLAEVEPVGREEYDARYRVRNRPLLAQVVRFHVGVK